MLVNILYWYTNWATGVYNPLKFEFLNLCNTLLYILLSLAVSSCSLIEWDCNFILNISDLSLLFRFFCTPNSYPFQLKLWDVCWMSCKIADLFWFLCSDLRFSKHLFVWPTYEYSKNTITALFFTWFLSLPLIITWLKLLFDLATHVNYPGTSKNLLFTHNTHCLEAR